MRIFPGTTWELFQSSISPDIRSEREMHTQISQKNNIQLFFEWWQPNKNSKSQISKSMLTCCSFVISKVVRNSWIHLFTQHSIIWKCVVENMFYTSAERATDLIPDRLNTEFTEAQFTYQVETKFSSRTTQILAIRKSWWTFWAGQSSYLKLFAAIPTLKQYLWVAWQWILAQVQLVEHRSNHQNSRSKLLFACTSLFCCLFHA